MKYCKLGNSDLDVSVACLGTMMWGSKNTQEEAFQQLDYFVEQGGTFIDTAELYAVPTTDENAGSTETIIGNWINARSNRDKVILATKVVGPQPHNRYPANRTDPRNPDAAPPRLDRANIMAAVEGSCRRLQTSYIDVYYLHWPDRYKPGFGFHQFDPAQVREYVPWEETVQAMGDLIRSGKIKYWALSNESAYGVCMMCETAKRLGVPLPVAIQNDYSLCERHFDLDTAEACAAYNVAAVPYGILAGGTLTGKYRGGAQPPGARHVSSSAFQPRYYQPSVMAAVEKYAALAERKGMSMTTLAVAWAASRWHTASVIVGQTSVEQLKECLAAVDVELDRETFDEVERIHREDRNPIWSD